MHMRESQGVRLAIGDHVHRHPVHREVTAMQLEQWNDAEWLLLLHTVI